MNWMLLPLKRYFDFSGRSRRLEYWLFTVFVWAVLIIEFMIIMMVTDALGMAGKGEDAPGIALLVVFFTWAGLFIPWLAALVRRLHDSDKSGLWLLIYFLPFGGLVLLVFMFLDGTEGPNSYGENPKDEEGAWRADVFA
jgi:uncharacterized membrane protein YhaH (DUF805 family)